MKGKLRKWITIYLGLVMLASFGVSNCFAMRSNKFDVTFIGTYLMDVMVEGFNKIPGAGYLEMIKNCEFHPGGNACNASINCAKLGLNVASVGCIGSDEQSEFLRKRFNKLGINCDNLLQLEGERTGISIVLVYPNKDKALLQLVGANKHLNKDILKNDVLDQSEFVVLSGLYLLPSLEKDLPQIFADLKNKGKTIIVNTSANVDIPEAQGIAKSIAQYVDYFILNDVEAYALTKKNTSCEKTKELQDMGFKNIIMTCGENGAFVLEKGKELYQVRPIVVDAIDTTGAGDAFVAGFICGLERNFSISDSVHLGNVVGSECVQVFSATEGVSVKALEKYMKITGKTDFVERIKIMKEKLITDIKSVDSLEAERAGISNNHRKLPNGERRFGLNSKDGSAYTRTEAPSTGACWQNSHLHSTLQEMYIVQKGFVVFAELENDKLLLRKMNKGDYQISRPGIPHNMYVSDGAVTHCVKYGDTSKNDWIPFPKLDALTKHLFVDGDFSILDNYLIP